MATYLELEAIASGNTLRARMTAAVAIQAEVVRTEAGGTVNHTNRLVWAKSAFADPKAMADRMIWAVLAQNAAFTTAQITGATDAALLSAVASAVDVFASGA